MKIFEENGRIRLQLMKSYQLNHGQIIAKTLFDFTIDKEEFESLRKHIIGHLQTFILEAKK